MRRLLTILVLVAAACAATGPEPALRLGVPGLSADVEQELRSAQTALQSASESADAWCALGDAWLAAARGSLELEAVRRARASFVRARVLARGPVEARALRGELDVALLRGRREEALRIADAALAEHPDDVGLACGAVEARLASGRIDEARARLEPLVHAGSAPAALRARVALAAGDAEGAVRLLDAETELGPELARARTEVGAALVRAGRTREACTFLARGADSPTLAPETRRTLEIALADAELADAERGGGDELARAALERCERLQHEAASPAARAIAARACRRLGRDDEAAWHAHEAEVVLRRAVAAGEVYACGPLARLVLEAGGDLDEALDLARRAAHADPGVDARALVERIELARAHR